MNTWYARVTPRGPDGTVLLAVRGADQPDGALITVDSAHTPDGCYLRAVADADGRIRRLQPVGSHRSPLWFVEVRDSAAYPPAVHLLAFTGHGQPTGALLDEAAASNTGVTSADQVAALQFYPATGEVFQVYVAPEWRRRQVGTALTLAAGCLAIARGWNRLWSDGQRTALGEAFRSGSTFEHRAAPHSVLLPAMDTQVAAG